MRHRRNLSAEETELWQHVTQDVAPLKRRRTGKQVKDADQPAVSALPATPKIKAPPLPIPTVPRVVRPALPPLTAINKHERRQIWRGTRTIDARIDLHGMRQTQAHNALRGFLSIAQMRGYTVVLVITGKGKADDETSMSIDERGVLRRLVPQWLRMPDMRALVIGFEEARQAHGGTGALYVRIRRLRRPPLP